MSEKRVPSRKEVLAFVSPIFVRSCAKATERGHSYVTEKSGTIQADALSGRASQTCLVSVMQTQFIQRLLSCFFPRYLKRRRRAARETSSRTGFMSLENDKVHAYSSCRDLQKHVGLRVYGRHKDYACYFVTTFPGRLGEPLR